MDLKTLYRIFVNKNVGRGAIMIFNDGQYREVLIFDISKISLKELLTSVYLGDLKDIKFNPDEWHIYVKFYIDGKSEYLLESYVTLFGNVWI